MGAMIAPAAGTGEKRGSAADGPDEDAQESGGGAGGVAQGEVLELGAFGADPLAGGLDALLDGCGIDEDAPLLQEVERSDGDEREDGGGFDGAADEPADGVAENEGHAESGGGGRDAFGEGRVARGGRRGGGAGEAADGVGGNGGWRLGLVEGELDSPADSEGGDGEGEPEEFGREESSFGRARSG